jgi:alkylhydroperoxidase family enzyme
VSEEQGYLEPPEVSPDVQRLYDEDVDDVGYVMNLTRLWAQQPDASQLFTDLLGRVAEAGALDRRRRGILVAACASTLGDAYCSLAWGTRLADEAGAEAAAGVLRGDDSGLTQDERALARFARLVARDPNRTEPGDVQALRDAGLSDQQVFAVTLYVSLRVAFSSVNDALGARPDRQLAERAPAPVRAAVTFGRPAAAEPS